LDGTAFLEVALRAVFLVSGALVGLEAVVADFLETDLTTFFVVVLEDLAVGLVVCVDCADDGALVFFLRLVVFEDVFEDGAGLAVPFLLVFFVAALVVVLGAALAVFAGFVFFPALEICPAPPAPDLVVFCVVFLEVFLDIFLEVFLPTLFAAREEAVF